MWLVATPLDNTDLVIRNSFSLGWGFSSLVESLPLKPKGPGLDAQHNLPHFPPK
jgi:hypothetical protein